MDSEARLSDHKRVSLKSALALKFGGLLELAEKATIIGELGKLLIEEVPLETTPPGYGRGPYHGLSHPYLIEGVAKLTNCFASPLRRPREDWTASR